MNRIKNDEQIIMSRVTKSTLLLETVVTNIVARDCGYKDVILMVINNGTDRDKLAIMRLNSATCASCSLTVPLNYILLTMTIYANLNKNVDANDRSKLPSYNRQDNFLCEKKTSTC